MTYWRAPPTRVLSRWSNLNPGLSIELSLDADCVRFLREHFPPAVAELFGRIPRGMYKADLWRLCALYIHGGCYADVDLVPYSSIDSILGGSRGATFVSCLAIDRSSVFQALILTRSPARSPLILSFLVSFLANAPWRNPHNGPTYDMYRCLQYSAGVGKLQPETRYAFREARFRVHVGACRGPRRSVHLLYFPPDAVHRIRMGRAWDASGREVVLRAVIRGHSLEVSRTDGRSGWVGSPLCEVCLPSRESVFLLPERQPPGGGLHDCFVTQGRRRVLDSREPKYRRSGGWAANDV